jgi:hypothetical protein
MAREDDDDRLTEAERRAIDQIRRELDAEFGPLDERTPDAPAERPPLRGPEPPPRGPEPPPRGPEPPLRGPEPPLRGAEPPPRGPEPPPRPPRIPRNVPPLREVPPPVREVPPRPAVDYGPITRARPARRRRGSLAWFLLGALVGGIAGGVAGPLATVAWLEYRMPLTPAGDRPAAQAPADTPAETPAAATRDTTSLNAALADWLDATKRGDIDAQMRFYPARVPVYYTWRDVPRTAVRAEKVRVFGGVTRLDITTDTPTVDVSGDGRTATARFRKRYVIEGPAVRRRGEVVQELRWSNTRDGWRIVAERDAEVLSP